MRYLLPALNSCVASPPQISAEEFAQNGDALRHLAKANKPEKRTYGNQPIDEPELTHTAFFKVQDPPPNLERTGAAA